MKLRAIIYTALVAAIVSPDATAAKKRRAAKPKFTAEELMTQASQAFIDYDVATAREKIAALRADKKADQEPVDSLERRVNRMDEMIQRAEDIAVIDSMNVGREDFFRAYRLSTTSGRLLSPEELGGDFAAAAGTVVYMPEDNSFMLWGTDTGLAESHRLTDGSWEDPSELGDVLNAGGTANYPFLMPDGTTLYYATDGEDSLGGLDLYISQRNRDGFAVPQNMGMPYNSPFDDYMLAIDEETGAGWFATDRNRLGDLITIYIFVPAESRVNLDVDREDLAERARIATLTSPLLPAHEALLNRISTLNDGNYQAVDDTPDFIFPLPDGRVYTRWSDFRSAQARRLMENYADAMAEDETDREALQRMRDAYGRGDSGKARQILDLERKIKTSANSLRKLANQVINAELK